MPFILILLFGLLLPRVTIFFLWLTGWFGGAINPLIGILGFLFMPYTLLWYSVVQNMFAGVWGPAALLGILIAMLLDLSSGGFGYRHYYVVG